MPEPWIDTIDDAAVRAVVGEDTFRRGAEYARAGRVERLTGQGGGALLGEVRGSGTTVYSTLITPFPAREGSARRWTARCSCPVGADCKHAVAVVVAARGGGLSGGEAPGGESGTGPSVEAGPGWEDRIGDLVRPTAEPAREPRGASLGLQLEIVVPPRVPGRGYGSLRPGAPDPARRLLLRPVVQGKQGDWVRAGASWRELEDGYPRYGRPVADAVQREALLELHAAYLSRGRNRYVAGERPVHLDDVGPGVWRLLPQLVAAGVRLMPAADPDGPVVLGGVAVASADLRRPRGTGPAVLEPVVTVAGVALPAGAADMVGSPVHGVVVEAAPGVPRALLGRGGLLLAPLEPVASPQLSALLHEGRKVEIPVADLPRFLREYYPGLRQVVPLSSSDGSVELPEVGEPTLALTVTHVPGPAVELAWGFRYPVGTEEVRVPLVAGDDGPAVRDAEAERVLLEAVAPVLEALPGLHGRADGSAASAAGALFLLPRTTLTGLDTVRFTGDVLPVLRNADVDVVVIGTPTEFRWTDSAPLIEVSATESGERDWFDLGVTVSVDGEQIPFHPLFVALAHGDSHLVLDSGTWFSIDRPELAQLRTLIEEARELQDKPTDGLRISAYQADLWDELTQLGVVQQQSARWDAAVRGLLDAAPDADPVPVPPGLVAELRPYQLDGFRWLTFLRAHGLGGVLADDMGLGKTVQALAMVLHAVQEGEQAPFLVVAPTSVVPNWVHEAERFAPGLRVVAISRTERASATSVARQVAGAHLVVTSYSLFRLDAAAYQGLPWAGLLLDEAQFVKNHQGRTHLVARRLDAPFKLAITGTPLENSLMELWSLLSIVAPGLYPNPRRFAAQYATPIAKGDTDRLALLRRRTRPLMRRRTKEQVATELPPKVEQVLEVALNPRHRRIYQTHLQRERQKVLHLIDSPDRNRFAILRSITLLRRLSLDPALVDDAYAGVAASKVDVLLERLAEVIEEGHRALVFSQFTGFLATVRTRLDAEGISYSYLDGRTRDRDKRLAAFRSGDDPVFLISLKAGGVGLNLTEADYVFILDPWWNPAVEAQAVDRTHRIGQQNTVMVYRLVATGTIEEKVMQLKERKLELFASVMDDDGALAGALTGEDLAGLLEG